MNAIPGGYSPLPTTLRFAGKIDQFDDAALAALKATVDKGKRGAQDAVMITKAAMTPRNVMESDEVACPNIDKIKGWGAAKDKKKAQALAKLMSGALVQNDIEAFNKHKAALYAVLEERGALGIPEKFTGATAPCRSDDKMTLVLSRADMLANRDLTGIDLSMVALRSNDVLGEVSKIEAEYGVTANGQTGSKVVHDKVILDGSNLAGANLLKASLCGADLAMVNLYNANLCFADLSRTTMDYTVFKGPELKLLSTIFTGCEIIGSLVIDSYEHLAGETTLNNDSFNSIRRVMGLPDKSDVLKPDEMKSLKKRDFTNQKQWDLYHRWDHTFAQADGTDPYDQV